MAKDLLRQYESYLGNVTPFIEDLCSEELDLSSEYLPGRERIEFYGEQLQFDKKIIPEEHVPGRNPRPNEYEEALFDRVAKKRDFEVLLLLGGLGAGKTTTSKLIKRWIDSRDHAAGKSTCHCSRLPCLRRVLLIDCSKYESPIKKKKLICDVLNDIRLAVYDQILFEWLAAQRIDLDVVKKEIDPRLRVLRRLLLRNDFLEFIGADDRPYSSFLATHLDLGPYEKLLNMRVSNTELGRLVRHHSPSISQLDRAVQKIVNQKKSSQQFLADVLQFYLHLCDEDNPRNTIFIDNLDQLPTGHIEALVTALVTVARKAPGVPFIVPLRPSSISGKPFTRRNAARYHYSPNNFDLILQRLKNRVLGKSRLELKTAISKLSSQTVTDDEVDILVLCIYTYALALCGGSSNDSDPESLLASLLHPDHSHLSAISISPGAIRDLAGTLDALVGRCCRYALQQLHLYCHNFYTLPSIFHGTVSTLKSSPHQTVLVHYGKMSYLLFAETRTDVEMPRVANLFMPIERPQPDAWPTLAKLRILYALKDNPRLSVRFLCERLAKYGIPRQIVVENLNALHRKQRLLVWFSKNRDLSANNKKDLDQQVVISEHGLRYVSELVCNFEYVWSCAAEIWETRDFAFSMYFNEKLNIYSKIIDRLGRTEWKQISIRRLRSNALLGQDSVVGSSGMLVLTFLYSTLGSLLSSSQVAVKSKRVGPEYKSETNDKIDLILDQITFWQDRYKVAFGSSGYLARYRGILSGLSAHLAFLLDSHFLREGNESKVNSFVEEWSRPAELVNPISIQGDTLKRLRPDLVTIGAQYALSLPVVNSIVQPQHQAKARDIFKRQVRDLLAELADALENRMPTYREVLLLLKLIVANLSRLSTAGQESAAVRTVEFRASLRDEEDFTRILHEFQHSSYQIPANCGLNEMTSIKQRYNNLIEMLSDLAAARGAIPEWYTELRWEFSGDSTYEA